VSPVPDRQEREALEAALEFLQTVEQWKGSDPDEIHELIAQIEAALAAREEPQEADDLLRRSAAAMSVWNASRADAAEARVVQADGENRRLRQVIAENDKEGRTRGLRLALEKCEHAIRYLNNGPVVESPEARKLCREAFAATCDALDCAREDTERPDERLLREALAAMDKAMDIYERVSSYSLAHMMAQELLPVLDRAKILGKIVRDTEQEDSE
jgi:hypothetical protein